MKKSTKSLKLYTIGTRQPCHFPKSPALRSLLTSEQFQRKKTYFTSLKLGSFP